MVTVWDWTILVIVVGLVSTFETLLIGSMIAKIFEAKAKALLECEMKKTDKSIEMCKNLFNSILVLIREAKNKTPEEKRTEKFMF